MRLKFRQAKLIAVVLGLGAWGCAAVFAAPAPARTSGRSRSAARRSRGELSETQLIEQTVRLGFNNVIDAFNVVNRGEIPMRFFVDERRGSTRGIRLTDELRRVHQDFQYRNLPSEVEARWRLVETAWEMNLPRGSGKLMLDQMTRDLIREHFGFRFAVCQHGDQALALEREVRAGSLPARRPYLNPL